LAPTVDRQAVEAAVAASGLQVAILPGRTYEMMRAADLLLAVSGTVTLEAAILGTPMIIMYRIATLGYLLGRLLVRVRFIGLPNLVANDGIVPEFVQFDVTPARLAATAEQILASPQRQAEIRAALTEVKERLGMRGAAERAAREVLALLPAS
jgi:lipid-A-disaccharide synthase